MASPTRGDVESRWQHLIDGTLSREEVHAWSAPWVEGEEDFDDLIAGIGLQYLHGFDLSSPPDDDGMLHHGGGPGRIYLRSVAEIASELDRWREDARAFNDDPGAWRRDRFQRLRRNLVQEGKLDEAERVERLLDELDDAAWP